MTIEQYEAPTHEVDVPRQAGALALAADQVEWTEQQQAALAQLGIAEAPKADQQVFMHVAQRSGLDPFARQIYLIGRYDKDAPGNKKWTIQTGIDGLRVMAERRPEYAGQTPPQWCDSDGKWTEVWLNKNTPPAAARVGVYRTDREHVAWAVCHFWEYAGTTRDGTLTKMWKDKGAHQIAKCAEAAALRKAFPQDFSGLYITEEMEAGENGTRAPMRARAQRTTVSAADLTGDAPAVTAAPAESTDVQMLDKVQGKRIGELFHAAGVDDKAARARIVDSLTDRPVKSAAELTHDEGDALIGELEQMGAEDIAALADIPAQTVDAETAGEALWPEPKVHGGEQ